jgi:hypothetical protein
LSILIPTRQLTLTSIYVPNAVLERILALDAGR